MDEKKKLSSVERIKAASRLLRGSIAEQLDDGTDHFSSDNVQLLKHHGMYQQDDRDARARARAEGRQGKAHMFLVRTRVPGGHLTRDQLLAELDLCDQIGNGTLRITSRQSLQLHGVLKGSLRTVMQRINRVKLMTLGACGDVNRNVMCCPAPDVSPIFMQLRQLTQQLAEHFAPRTGAYREIWLLDPESGDKQRVAAQGVECEDEPLYGPTYLPRKFKIGIALPRDNCIDVYTHDLGLLAIVEGDELAGFNMLAGGGMGVTPSRKSTFPALGKRLGFVRPDQVVEAAEAIVTVQRDLGNREDRKTARLKYLIHRLGLDVFRDKVEQHLGWRLEAPRAQDVTGTCDHLGWHAQGDGRWYYGLNIENGRIADRDAFRLKSAIREICRQFRPDFRLTAYQKLLLTGIAEEDRGAVETVFRDHGVALTNQISVARRWSMACVALPTCGLAVTESERVLPSIMDQLEKVLDEHGLSEEVLTVRMTGCPNGCVRPFNGDIGLVGKAKGRYTILLGGNPLGTRLNVVYQDLVPAEEIVPTLSPLLAWFQRDRQRDESFGDFCHRQGTDRLRERAARTQASEP